MTTFPLSSLTMKLDPFSVFQPWVVSVELLSNASGPILVTESGIVIEASEEHEKNAHLPMLVTESGIVIVLSYHKQLNACKPILVTYSGI